MLISAGFVRWNFACLKPVCRFVLCVGACVMFSGEFGVCIAVIFCVGWFLPSGSCSCFHACYLVVWLSASVPR